MPVTDRFLATVRPEIKLLLLCARTSMDDSQTTQARELMRQELDWIYLLDAASRHGVSQLLYANLDGIDSVPENVCTRLRDDYYNNARHNMVLTGELIRLLRLFALNAIHALPYKGPALAALAYGDTSYRAFGDLDILIRKDDFYRAKQALTGAGYVSFSPSRVQRDEAQLQFSGDYNFVREDGQVHVDLQWTALTRFFAFPLSTEYLWERRKMVSIAGTAIPSLSRQDLLLILCAHGAKHLWTRLSWICDVAELLRRQDFDWQAVLHQARTAGGERMLLLGLYLAQDLLQVPLPEFVHNRVYQDRAVQSLASQIRQQLFDYEPLRISPFHLRVRERMRDKLRYCLHWAVTPIDADLRLLSLPERFLFLYYPVHLARQTYEYGIDALRYVFRRVRSSPG
jgi:hypothetical protein